MIIFLPQGEVQRISFCFLEEGGRTASVGYKLSGNPDTSISQPLKPTALSYLPMVVVTPAKLCWWAANIITFAPDLHRLNIEQKLPVILTGAGSAHLKNLPPNGPTCCFEGVILFIIFFLNFSGINKLRTHLCSSNGRRSGLWHCRRWAAWRQGLMVGWCEIVANLFLRGRATLVNDTLGQDNLLLCL